MKPKNIAIIVLVVLFAAILIQNTEVVSLEFLFWDLSMSKIVFIPSTLAIGAIIGFVVAKLISKKKS
ncbi:MAG: LapA family protein [Thermodesulfobacteriota bacterium]|nr:LapA family protein [Thermodesulfobacteriota bacterium]